MMMSERNIIELETGWEFLQKGITKIKNIMEGILEKHFSSEEYIILTRILFFLDQSSY